MQPQQFNQITHFLTERVTEIFNKLGRLPLIEQTQFHYANNVQQYIVAVREREDINYLRSLLSEPATFEEKFKQRREAIIKRDGEEFISALLQELYAQVAIILLEGKQEKTTFAAAIGMLWPSVKQGLKVDLSLAGPVTAANRISDQIKVSLSLNENLEQIYEDIGPIRFEKKQDIINPEKSFCYQKHTIYYQISDEEHYRQINDTEEKVPCKDITIAFIKWDGKLDLFRFPTSTYTLPFLCTLSDATSQRLLALPAADIPELFRDATDTSTPPTGDKEKENFFNEIRRFFVKQAEMKGLASNADQTAQVALFAKIRQELVAKREVFFAHTRALCLKRKFLRGFTTLASQDAAYAVVRNGIFFDVGQIDQFNFSMHQQLYNLLTKNYPAIADGVYNHNTFFQQLARDIRRINHQGLTVRDLIQQLLDALQRNGVIAKGIAMLNDAGKEALQAYQLDFKGQFNLLANELKNAVRGLYVDASQQKTLADVFGHLDKGGCIEYAAGNLREILALPANAAILATPCHLPKETITKIKNIYNSKIKNDNTKIKNPEKVFLVPSLPSQRNNFISTISAEWLTTLGDKITISHWEPLLSFLSNVAPADYEVLLSNAKIQPHADLNGDLLGGMFTRQARAGFLTAEQLDAFNLALLKNAPKFGWENIIRFYFLSGSLLTRLAPQIKNGALTPEQLTTLNQQFLQHAAKLRIAWITLMKFSFLAGNYQLFITAIRKEPADARNNLLMQLAAAMKNDNLTPAQQDIFNQAFLANVTELALSWKQVMDFGFLADNGKLFILANQRLQQETTVAKYNEMIAAFLAKYPNEDDKFIGMAYESKNYSLLIAVIQHMPESARALRIEVTKHPELPKVHLLPDLAAIGNKAVFFDLLRLVPEESRLSLLEDRVDRSQITERKGRVCDILVKKLDVVFLQELRELLPVTEQDELDAYFIRIALQKNNRFYLNYVSALQKAQRQDCAPMQQEDFTDIIALLNPVQTNSPGKILFTTRQAKIAVTLLNWFKQNDCDKKSDLLAAVYHALEDSTKKAGSAYEVMAELLAYKDIKTIADIIKAVSSESRVRFLAEHRHGHYEIPLLQYLHEHELQDDFHYHLISDSTPETKLAIMYDVLSAAINISDTTLINLTLIALSPAERQKILTEEDSQGNTLLHQLFLQTTSASDSMAEDSADEADEWDEVSRAKDMKDVYTSIEKYFIEEETFLTELLARKNHAQESIMDLMNKQNDLLRAAEERTEDQATMEVASESVANLTLEPTSPSRSSSTLFHQQQKRVRDDQDEDFTPSNKKQKRDTPKIN